MSSGNKNKNAQEKYIIHCHSVNYQVLTGLKITQSGKIASSSRDQLHFPPFMLQKLGFGE